MEAFSSSTPFFVIRDDDQLNQFNDQQHQQSSPAQQPPFSATANPPGILPAKKKRNHPGNPNPDAEVIALSPKTLMATNRFICEVCNKGFQREQNLQLHRRGHNLPWKLKQKSTKEVRRRVYLCPEPGCVHHDPSRALGDLTGVKKHFSRKHGEKKWKCDKCSKRYAVQSDCKAHSKTCGTREYRCDCGTLFSRRDSFITHRAFCDALAQENSRFATGLTTFGSHLYRNNDSSNISLGLSPDLLRLGIPTSAPSAQSISLASTQFDHLVTPANPPFSFRPPHLPPSASNFFLGCDSLQSKPSFHGLAQFPSLQPNSSHNPSSNLYNLNFFSNGGNEAAMPLMMPDQFNCGNLVNDHMHSLFNGDNEVLPQMSATALLQRAAEMGSTSNMGDQMLRTQVESHEKQLMDIMNSFANGSSNVFGGGQEKEEGGATKFGELEAGLCNMEEGGYQSAGLTRDFLGVGTMLRSMGRGMALDPRDMNNSATSGRSFLSEDL